MSYYFRTGHERAFGTWPLKGDELRQALRLALDAGYRAIDTAQSYGNEADVGLALRDAGLPRDRLCVTTKVAPENDSDERFLPSVEASLERLGLSQVDVLLVHWPPPGGDVAPTVRRLEQARRAGLARHVGISNFTAAMMRAARRAIDEPLVVNQVEFHPLLDQRKLLQAAAETGIPLGAYTPVARGKVFEYPLFDELAAAYGRTPAQIVLRWILQKGVQVNTMSTRAENIRDNFAILDFTLSSPDVARIDALGAVNHRIVDRARVPYAPVWD